jgi:hypothetical protein
MNYKAACVVILSSLVLVVPAEARWIDIPEVTNDGATLSFDSNDIGRTRFQYRIIEGENMREQMAVTNWCYRGKVKRNPNAAPTTNTPGWHIYNTEGVTSVYANSPASRRLLTNICAGQ